MRLFSLNKLVLVLVVLTTALLVFAGCSTAEETPDIEQTAEAEGRSLAERLGNVTTVSVTYTLENDTSGLKEEKSWKMFYQGSGGQAFGFNGAILPNSSIDRSFTFGAVAPNGLLRLVYPAGYPRRILGRRRLDLGRHQTAFALAI